MPPRPLLKIAQECLQRLTGAIPDPDLSIQKILDQCHTSLGTPQTKTVIEDLRELSAMLEVQFESSSTSLSSGQNNKKTSSNSSTNSSFTSSSSEKKKKPKIRVLCEICGKELSSGAAFASHMRSHSKESDLDLESKIEDFGLSPEQVVQNVLIKSIIEPVIKRVEKERKIEKSNGCGFDGRKMNRTGGNKHRKTYTLTYKAKCIDLYEIAALSGVPSPQLDVARSEQIDVSMLGRWINSKDKILESVAAQGHKKILSKDKIDKKALGKKKRKRKASVDMSSVNPPANLHMFQPQHHHHPQHQQIDQRMQLLQQQQQHLHMQQQQQHQQQQQQQQHDQQHHHHLHQQQQQQHIHMQQQQQQQPMEGGGGGGGSLPLHMILLPEMQV